MPGTLNGEETPVNLFRRMNREAEPSLRITSGCAPLVLSMTGTLLPATGHSLPIPDLCLLVAVGLVLKALLPVECASGSRLEPVVAPWEGVGRILAVLPLVEVHPR